MKLDWEKNILPEVRDYEPAQYVYSGGEKEPEIDCSLGTNPFGANERIMHKWTSGFSLDPSLYPADQSGVIKAITDFWRGAVKEDEIVFGSGSIGVIFSLARVLVSPGTEILGIAPQFSDGAFYFTFSGASVKNVKLQAPDYAINVKRIEEGLTDNISAVYMDRPHNPTGQVMSLDSVRELADRCDKSGALLIVDEAYGGFIPEEESAINLENRSIVCLRSFSKAWGLAGLRVGYAVIRDERLRKYYRKVSPPFSIPASALELLPMIIKDRDYLKTLRERIAEVKRETMEMILPCEGFSIAPTCPTVPIMMLTWDEDPTLDLHDFLLKVGGIKTEPGWGFENLGSNSVRFRVPGPDRMKVLKTCWSKVCDQIKDQK